MRKILYFMIALTVLSFASCKDTEGSIGDPIISHGQDRDTDIITGDDYVYHLPVIFMSSTVTPRNTSNIPASRRFSPM